MCASAESTDKPVHTVPACTLDPQHSQMIDNHIYVRDSCCWKILKHGLDCHPDFLALPHSQPCLQVDLSKDCHPQSTALQGGSIALHPSLLWWNTLRPCSWRWCHHWPLLAGWYALARSSVHQFPSVSVSRPPPSTYFLVVQMT